MPNDCEARKDTMEKSLVTEVCLEKALTEVASKISQAVLSLHKNENLTLKHRKGNLFYFLKQHFVFVLCYIIF